MRLITNEGHSIFTAQALLLIKWADYQTLKATWCLTSFLFSGTCIQSRCRVLVNRPFFFASSCPFSPELFFERAFIFWFCQGMPPNRGGWKEGWDMQAGQRSRNISQGNAYIRRWCCFVIWCRTGWGCFMKKKDVFSLLDLANPRTSQTSRTEEDT